MPTTYQAATAELQPGRASFGVPTGMRGLLIRDIIAQVVAHALSVAPERITRERRGSPAEVHARQCAIYLTHFSANLPMPAAAAMFARARSTATHACQLIEQARDQYPMTDRAIQALEAAVKASLVRSGLLAETWPVRCRHGPGAAPGRIARRNFHSIRPTVCNSSRGPMTKSPPLPPAMPDSRQSGPPALSDDLPLLLARLSRKGASLFRETHDGTHTFHIVIPGNRYRRGQPTRQDVAGRLVAQAIAAGWVGDSETADCLRLTEAGAIALARGSARKLSAPAKAPRPSDRHALSARPTPAIADTASPLARLRRQRGSDGQPLITGGQMEAGEKLAGDFMLGQMMPCVTAKWDGIAQRHRERRAAPGHGIEISENVSAAQTRVRRALEAAGPELANLLVDICCFEVGLEQAERHRHWPPRSGRIVLRVALDQLLRHYRLTAETRPAAEPPRGWHGPDYRPTLAGWRDEPRC